MNLSQLNFIKNRRNGGIPVKAKIRPMQVVFKFENLEI